LHAGFFVSLSQEKMEIFPVPEILALRGLPPIPAQDSA
jgi:hypothetical protein